MNPDFEAMTIDELVEWKLARKREVEALKDGMREAHQVMLRKIILRNLAGKLRVPVEGLTVEQATALLEIAKQTPPREGDVVVTPEPGEVIHRLGVTHGMARE